MGAKLELWWAGNRRWFAGKIADIDRSTGKVLIKYMDGDWKWHKLWQEAIRGVRSPVFTPYSKAPRIYLPTYSCGRRPAEKLSPSDAP